MSNEFKSYKRAKHTPIGGILPAEVNATAATDLIEHFVNLFPSEGEVGIDDAFMRVEALAAHVLAVLVTKDNLASKDPERMAALVMQTCNLFAENTARLTFNKLVGNGYLSPEAIRRHELSHSDDEGPQHAQRSH